MTHDMKAGMFQPRWRRMKEKPPARNPHPAKKAAAAHAKPDAAWPATRRAHRVDKA